MRGLLAAAKNVVQQQQWNSICNTSRNSTRNYVLEKEKHAFEGKIIRLINKEIHYMLEYSPPSPIYQFFPRINIHGGRTGGEFAASRNGQQWQMNNNLYVGVAASSGFPQSQNMIQHIPEFDVFEVDERPGEQFIRLVRKFGETEDVKVEVTMFDGSVPVKKAGNDSDNEDDMKLHITLIIDIFKRGSINMLEFVCSAWPNNIEIRKVFTRGLERTKDLPYLGPDFKELDDEIQNSLYDFLEARGVNDNLAVFLHRYMSNKDKVEYIRWMEKVNSYFQKSRS